jgi:dihydroorotase
MTDHLRIRKPDDWHLHLRDGAALQAVLAHTAAQFGRAIVMPNLKPAVTTVALAAAYRERILAARPRGSHFEPLMTLYLTDSTNASEILAAKKSGFIHGCKLYPAGVTTHADAGVTDMRRIDAALEAMAAVGLPLLVHGEVTQSHVDIFDREARFIDEVLTPLRTRLPSLRIVLEHATTKAAVEFVRSASQNVAATLTPQHLMLNRNALFAGGLRPHHFCLPVLKRETDRVALLEAATSGDARFFLGTDSAPHSRASKESACGCAGVYSAHAALELYLSVFEDAGALTRFENFASVFGANFYGLPLNTEFISLRRDSWRIPDSYPFADETLVPFAAGETLRWRLAAS